MERLGRKIQDRQEARWLSSFAWIAILGSLTCLSACATGGGGKKELSRADRAAMLVDVANGALKEGDATGALEILLQAEKEDSELPELHHSKAIAFYIKRDLASAAREARRAVELKSDYSDANNTLGKLLMDQGKAGDAIPYLSKAAVDPLYRDAYKPLTNLGILHYRRGEYAEADRFLGRAVESAPVGACVAYYYRGHLRLRESRFQEALKDYDNAGKRVCGGFADAHLAMGIAYERSRQYEQARGKYLEIQNRFPNTQVAQEAISHLRFLP